MELKDQVTSLELSKRLKELGAKYLDAQGDITKFEKWLLLVQADKSEVIGNIYESPSLLSANKNI